jgi:hypothetical protein
MENQMKVMKSFVLAALLFVSAFSFASDKFPVGPNPTTTPGSLCQNSPVKRYPEGITYCQRDVSSETKRALIKMYDDQFGYQIEHMNRQDFKIDHFIPLSIGGSNSKDNLWPQHKSVYNVTDPLEQLLSDKISAGLIKQAEAVRVIREAKLNLARVPELTDYVNGMH